MTRLAVAFDRFAALLLGVCLAAAGGLLIWARMQSKALNGLPLQGLTDTVGQSWWAWAGAGAGAVLVVLGLRWLASHRRAPRAPRLGLTNIASAGTLTADPSAVAEAAAEALRTHASVLRASARASVERGVPTITLTATTPAQQGLSGLVAAADEAAVTAARMLGDTVAVSTRIRVDAKRRRVVG